MKIYHTVTVPARTEERLQCVECDFCKKKIQQPGAFEVSETTISHKDGTNYGTDGAWGTLTEFDACPQCWAEKITPALIALGATPNTKEWEW